MVNIKSLERDGLPQAELCARNTMMIEITVASLRKGKSVGVDNIPAKLVQAGGETMIDV